MKELYRFTVRENVEDGDPIMHQVSIGKPNRRQIEEADMEYSITLSNCVSKGVLTKQMLAKKYSDSGGIMSEYDAKKLLELYVESDELSNKLARISSMGGKNKKSKQDSEKLTEKLASKRREIVEMETNYQSLFNHTADTKAQNAVVRWYVLHLVNIFDEQEDKFIPYFKGNYEERTNNYYEKEDEGDETYQKIMSKAASIVSLWFFNDAESTEEIDDLLEKIGFDIDMNDEEGPKEAAKPEEEKPKAKPPAKKAVKKVARKTAKKTKVSE